MCFRRRDWTQGIFCANCSWSVGHFSPCHQMWCGRYYTTRNNPLFHVAFPVIHGIKKGKEKEELKKKEILEVMWKSKHWNEMDFHEARNGDHLLVIFECDLCIFRKLRHTNPVSNLSQDYLLLACIRRIDLDTFWSRTRLTVQ